QGQRISPADAGAGARHQRDLAVEIHRYLSPPVVFIPWPASSKGMSAPRGGRACATREAVELCCGELAAERIVGPDRVAIKNIVLDLGNVVVRWDPGLICAMTFGEVAATPELTQSIFRDPLWYQLNRGEITEIDAKRAYCQRLGREAPDLDRLFLDIKASQE